MFITGGGLIAAAGLGALPPSTAFYVSLAGNDANPGTEAQPWLSITKVNAGTYPAGSTIQFRGGDTFSGALVFTSTNLLGTSSTPIVIGSYGTGKATISSGASAGASFTSVAGFELKDLNFVGNGAANVNGVHIANTQAGSGKLAYVRLTNLDVGSYGRNGIALIGGYGPTGTGTDTAGFTDVVMSGCVVHDNCNIAADTSGTAGIRVAGWYGFNGPGTAPTHTNVTVTGCHVHTNPGRAGVAMWTGSGIVFGEVQTGSIRLCRTNANGANNTNGAGPVGIWCYDSDSITFEYNESHHNLTGPGGGNGGGFDFGGGTSNSIMQYNYSHDNAGQGYFCYQNADSVVNNWKDNTVRYNISQNDNVTNPSGGYSGCLVIASDHAALTNARVYNNIFYNNSDIGRAVRIDGSAVAGTTGLVANNIFYSVGGAWLIETGSFNPSNLIFRGNDYYAADTWRIGWNGVTHSTLAAFRSGAGQEIHASANVGAEANPLLNNPGGGGTTGGYNPESLSAYKTQNNSPMRNAGLNLITLFSIDPGTHDYYGNTIPVDSAFDIGAFDGVAASGSLPGTVDVAIATSSDDAFETFSTGAAPSLTGTSLIANANNQIGLRFVFTGAKPYKGATITTAYLTIRSSGTIAAGQTVRFWCQDSDSTTTFTTTPFDVSGLGSPSSRPKTTQFVDWTTPAFTAESFYDTPSIIAPVQAVVNRVGWDEASIVVVIHRPAGTANVGIRSLDSAVASAAVLHLAWT